MGKYVTDNFQSYPWRGEFHLSGGSMETNTNGFKFHIHGDRPQSLSSATEGAAE